MSGIGGAAAESRLSAEFNRIYAKPDLRVSIRSDGARTARCDVTGLVTVHSDMASVMLDAFRKGQRGGFFILDHEQGHIEEGSPMRSNLLDTDDAPIGAVDLAEEREADAYALRKTSDPIGDLASALAIYLLSNHDDGTIELCDGKNFSDSAQGVWAASLYFLKNHGSLSLLSEDELFMLKPQVFEKFEQLRR